MELSHLVCWAQGKAVGRVSGCCAGSHWAGAQALPLASSQPVLGPYHSLPEPLNQGHRPELFPEICLLSALQTSLLGSFPQTFPTGQAQAVPSFLSLYM